MQAINLQAFRCTKSVFECRIESNRISGGNGDKGPFVGHMQAVKRKGHKALDLAWLSCQFPGQREKKENYLPGCPKHCWCQQIPFQRLQKNVRPLPKEKNTKKNEAQ